MYIIVYKRSHLSYLSQSSEDTTELKPAQYEISLMTLQIYLVLQVTIIKVFRCH